MLHVIGPPMFRSKPERSINLRDLFLLLVPVPHFSRRIIIFIVVVVVVVVIIIRSKMALEWVVLGYAAAAEAIMVLFLTLPGLDFLRKGLISVIQKLLKPFLSVVPFCIFLLMDIYWKYETRPSCESHTCSPSEHLLHEKSIMKSQRNVLLIFSALIFYWLLYSVTGLLVRLDQLNKRLDMLKSRD